jgi:hypothetical protein
MADTQSFATRTEFYANEVFANHFILNNCKYQVLLNKVLQNVLEPNPNFSPNLLIISYVDKLKAKNGKKSNKAIFLLQKFTTIYFLGKLKPRW